MAMGFGKSSYLDFIWGLTYSVTVDLMAELKLIATLHLKIFDIFNGTVDG